ncbi:hypothetical protein CRYUN_Cryun10bG0129000 [Craigia yunnanensis]
MKSFLSFFSFLSLLLFADTIAAARKDAGEYWKAVMKDEPMPEAIKGLVRIDAVSSSNEKTDCHTPTSFEIKEEKIIVEDFERPRPNKGDEKKKSFADDFEPRPNLSSYGDDADLKGEKSSSYAKDFEPRPNLSAYGDDADLKGEKSSSYAKDFEPRSNLSAYGDDADLKGEKSSSYAKDFEPRPNLSAYGDDADLKGEKSLSYAKDFEPRPNLSAYGGDSDDASLKGEKKNHLLENLNRSQTSAFTD